MASWLFSGSSVVGQSHLTTSTPCQDKFQLQTSKDGNWLAMAICDGAGSAEFAELGASITSQHFCQELIKLSHELDSRTPGEWINDFVIDCVIQVRNQLRSAAKSDDIRKYHCTLVAALVGKSGGFSIHIGDGAVIGGTFGQASASKPTELNSDYFISKPENGEYANETYFITEGSWVKHLRITPLPRLDWIVACTDGGASLLLDNELQVKPNFLAPFIETQVNKRFTDQLYIESVLNDPKANKLTTDDKTIVLAVRSSSITLPASFQFSIEEKTPAQLVQAAPPAVVTASAHSIQAKSSPQSQAKSTASAPQQSVGNTVKKNPSQGSSLISKLIFGLSGLIILLAIAFIAWMYREIWLNALPASDGTKGLAPPVIDKKISNEPQKEVALPSTTLTPEKHGDETTGR